MRWLVVVLLALTLGACGEEKKPAAPAQEAREAPAAANGRHIALVIGNADYNGDGNQATPEMISRLNGFPADLAKTLNDASDIRDTLLGLGFDAKDVKYVSNGDRPEMFAALDWLGQKAASAGPDAVVVFYYAGHAMQVDGVNLLIPVKQQIPKHLEGMTAGARLETLAGVTVTLPRVLEQFVSPDPASDGVNILILDSCRNNFWDSSVNGIHRSAGSAGGLSNRGVAEHTRDLRSTIIAFSTQPGNVASDGAPDDRNSPYTGVLKTYLAIPGMPVVNLFNAVSREVERKTASWELPQRPWNNTVSLPDVCLAGCGADAPPARTAGSAARTVDLLAGRWSSPSGGCDNPYRYAIEGDTLTITAAQWRSTARIGAERYGWLEVTALSPPDLKDRRFSYHVDGATLTLRDGADELKMQACQ